MSLGVTEMVLLLAIVLLLFGAGKLPTVMGDLAKGVRNFKTGMGDDTDRPTTVSPATVSDEPAATPRIAPPGKKAQ